MFSSENPLSTVYMTCMRVFVEIVSVQFVSFSSLLSIGSLTKCWCFVDDVQQCTHVTRGACRCHVIGMTSSWLLSSCQAVVVKVH